MSRCKACNNTMTDAEMVRRDILSGDFAELCSVCMIDSDEAYVNAIFEVDSEDAYLLDEVE